MVEAIIAVVVFLVVVGWVWSDWRAKRSVFDVFELSPDDFRLIGTDLGRLKPLYLRLGLLRGAPDGAFIRRRGKDGVVGEFKSREHRGFVRRRERYQCVLYMGMLKKRYNLDKVRAVLRFADTCVDIPFDSVLFDRLVAMASEFQTARKHWRARNVIPLHKRSFAN